MRTTEEALYAYGLVGENESVLVYTDFGYEISTVRRSDYSDFFAYWNEEIGDIVLGIHNWENEKGGDRFQIIVDIDNVLYYTKEVLHEHIRELLMYYNDIKNKNLRDYTNEMKNKYERH